jgi:hypothetical protein
MKGALGSPKLILEDNIKLDLKEIGRVWTGFIWPQIGSNDER